MKRIVSIGALAAVCLLAAAPAAAVDGIAIEAGGGDSTDMGRIAIQWDWNKRWFQGQEWHVGGYWDLGIGYWTRDALPDQNGDITEIGLTPVFRLQRNTLQGPYAEIGIGFHLLSKTTIGDKRFSTLFQFGDHLGFGYRFGVKSAWDVGYRYQHLSNANIKKPNNGISFNQVRLQYHF
jgi:opacity protein-like surface antigen